MPAVLTSGTYAARAKLRVIVWKAPDHQGDADPVWVDQKDEYGRNIGRIAKTDEFGRDVRRYFPPEGFKDFPSFDHTSAWVMVDDRGRVVRNANGEAIGIQEGQALILAPDNTFQVLKDGYEQYLFMQAHDTVESDVTPVVPSVES